MTASIGIRIGMGMGTRSAIIFLEDLRKEFFNYHLVCCLLIFQLLQCFLLDPGPGSLAITERLFQEFFYLVSLAASMVFSVYGSVALTEEERQGTLQTLFLAPISVREYLWAKISFPILAWALTWCLILLNLGLMRGTLGLLPLGDVLIASIALFLCVLSIVLLTLLVSVLLRDSRVALLLVFSLIFIHLVIIQPLYMIGMESSHPLAVASWFFPFLHASKIWIWVFERISYGQIAINAGLEMVWLGSFCVLVVCAMMMILTRRYRRSIE